MEVENRQMLESMNLRDGRMLAYSEFGDPAGAPVVFFHGWMASRLVRHPDDSLTRSLGVRLITVDRPGVGQSSAFPDTTFASFAGDVEALANHLLLDRFAVFGHSGGGPFALACAGRLPTRVIRAAVASGFAPFDRPDPYEGMTNRMRSYVRLMHRAPWLAGPMLRGVPRRFRKDPEKAFAKQFSPLCEADERVLAEPAAHALVLESAVQALAPGSAGVASESKLLFVKPWGFSLADITCPVDLWYGDADSLVPPEMGRYLASAIPNGDITVLPGEGHMMFITHWADILRRLTAQTGPE
jgi:pimeloyl-ACP methyl ester carboxylesterase